MKSLILAVAAALLAGCATGYNPSYHFKQVEVVNLAGAPLQNLSWNVVGSGKSMNCSEVAPNAICADYFPQRRYPRAGIELSWTHADGERRSEVPNPAVPAFFYAAFPLRVIIEIDAEGSLNAYYDQDTPGDNLFISGG